MHSCYDVWRQGRLHELAMPSHNAEILAQQGLRGGGAKAHQNIRFHCRELRIQPGTAGIDFPVAWFLVDAPFSALVRRPVEMLHHIRNIYITSSDANLCQGLIKEPSGRTHEGMTSEIFSVPGLFANEDDFSMCAPFAEHRLGGSFPKVASLAARCSRTQVRDSWSRRDQRSGGLLRFLSDCFKVSGHDCFPNPEMTARFPRLPSCFYLFVGVSASNELDKLKSERPARRFVLVSARQLGTRIFC